MKNGFLWILFLKNKMLHLTSNLLEDEALQANICFNKQTSTLNLPGL
jgi:hypothetical protein